MTTLSLGRNELAFDDRPYTCTSVEGFELGVCEAPDHNDSLEDYFDINPFGLDQWENLQRPEPPGSMAYTNLDSSGIAVTLKQTTRALQDGSRAAGAPLRSGNTDNNLCQMVMRQSDAEFEHPVKRAEALSHEIRSRG
jgi:hypothetical protein